MLFRLVEVTWDDAHGGDSGWKYLDDAVRVGTTIMQCKTCGYIIVDNDEVLTIAGTISYDINGNVDQVNGAMSIPRGMVRKVRRLK